MALSDTCYESLSELGSAVSRYSDWGYKLRDISGVVDAMFSLAEVGFRLDMPHLSYPQNEDLIVSRAVFLALVSAVSEDDEADRESIITLLSELACENHRFARSMVDIEKWLLTDQGKHSIKTDYPQFQMIGNILAKARMSLTGLAA